MHAVRWLFYLVRLAIYRLLGVLRFISKPGSRIIFPVVLVGLAVLERPELHYQLLVAAWELDRTLKPHWLALDAVLILAGVVAIYVYSIVSQILALLMGAFPVAQRPLPPMRRLMPTKQEITSIPVRIAVPTLRRRQAQGTAR